MSAEFNKAAEDAKNLSKASNQDKLDLYKLFKQATVGDINTDRPGMFDQTGRYKWDAWSSVKGMSKADAEAAYIAKVKELQAAQ